jgi:hypothetical protein
VKLKKKSINPKQGQCFNGIDTNPYHLDMVGINSKVKRLIYYR